jgi:hypothetical protein
VEERGTGQPSSDAGVRYLEPNRSSQETYAEAERYTGHRLEVNEEVNGVNSS